MYTCGPTVWNYAHIGNFRTFVFEDVLRRYLKFKGYKVTPGDEHHRRRGQDNQGDEAIRKIPRGPDLVLRARVHGGSLTTLNIERAEVYPRATKHIPEMVDLIKTLMQKGYAYRADDGSVYYDVSKFERYGELSGIRPSQLVAGARVKNDSYDKEQANDFALWKAWDADDGEVFWETELGKGRPGWHIECSAMSMKYLGETFDIHTGGIDNRFPHHENEIAQSEAATGKEFVRFWLHSDFLNVSGEEMHKSVGNVVTLRQLTEKGWKPRAIRLFLIGAHYRDKLDLTDESLQQAKSNIARIDGFFRAPQGSPGPGGRPRRGRVQQLVPRGVRECHGRRPQRRRGAGSTLRIHADHQHPDRLRGALEARSRRRRRGPQKGRLRPRGDAARRGIGRLGPGGGVDTRARGSQAETGLQAGGRDTGTAQEGGDSPRGPTRGRRLLEGGVTTRPRPK